MAFVEAFSEWVDACFFDETEVAARRLDALLELPADDVLRGSLAVLSRLVEAFAPTSPGEVAAALAQHLIIRGPDTEREALIRDVVLATRSTPAGRAELFAGHPMEALIGAALECSSLLAQTVADREGVVPSSILRPL